MNRNSPIVTNRLLGKAQLVVRNENENIIEIDMINALQTMIG